MDQNKNECMIDQINTAYHNLSYKYPKILHHGWNALHNLVHPECLIVYVHVFVRITNNGHPIGCFLCKNMSTKYK